MRKRPRHDYPLAYRPPALYSIPQSAFPPHDYGGQPLCETESKPDNPQGVGHNKGGADEETPFNDPKTGRFVPGHKMRGGIAKGGKHRFTKLKDAFLQAFEELGGAEFVKATAQKEPDKVLAIIARMLPRYSDIALTPGTDTPGAIEPANLSDEELRHILTQEEPEPDDSDGDEDE